MCLAVPPDATSTGKLDTELQRLHGKMKKLGKAAAKLRARLDNAGFVARSPLEVQEKERGRLVALEAEIEGLEQTARMLEAARA